MARRDEETRTLHVSSYIKRNTLHAIRGKPVGMLCNTNAAAYVDVYVDRAAVAVAVVVFLVIVRLCALVH